MIPVAIVTLDRAALFVGTVNSVLRTAPGAPLAIVDNGSAEAAAQQYLRAIEARGIPAVRNRRNLGTGRARNQAVALLPPSELICVADNDVRFHTGWWEAAEAAFSAFDRLGVLGLWKHPWHRTLQVEERSGRRLLVRNLMPGVALVLRRSLWDAVGGVAELPPHAYGGESTSLEQRVSARGLWVAGLEDDPVEHLGHIRTDGRIAQGSTGTRWLPA